MKQEAEVEWHPFECYINPEHHHPGINLLPVLPNIPFLVLSLLYYVMMSLGQGQQLFICNELLKVTKALDAHFFCFWFWMGVIKTS